jgi:hypothetical protein
MARRSTMLLTSIIVFLLAAHQAQAQGTVKFDDKQPSSPAGGKISGTGTYTVAMGSTAGRVEMFAKLAKGPGQGGWINTTLDVPTKSFSGLITALPAGDYNVFARITIIKGAATLYFDSDITTVTVAAAK